jgi:hypothetical protein
LQFLLICLSVIAAAEPLYGTAIGVVMPAVSMGAIVVLYLLLMMDFFQKGERDSISQFYMWCDHVRKGGARAKRRGLGTYEDPRFHEIPHQDIQNRIRISKAMAELDYRTMDANA